MMKVSVIVANVESEACLALTLSAVQHAFTDMRKVDVWVSGVEESGLSVRIRKRFPNIQILPEEAPKGEFPQAWLAGLQSDYLLSLSAGVVIPENFPDFSITYLEHNQTCSCCTGSVITPGNPDGVSYDIARALPLCSFYRMESLRKSAPAACPVVALPVPILRYTENQKKKTQKSGMLEWVMRLFRGAGKKKKTSELLILTGESHIESIRSLCKHRLPDVVCRFIVAGEKTIPQLDNLSGDGPGASIRVIFDNSRFSYQMIIALLPKFQDINYDIGIYDPSAKTLIMSMGIYK